MSEKENTQKTDFLSNLRSQKPNTTTKIQDETLDDDIWNEASDEDEEQQVTKISNKMSSNLLAKEDNSKKKYSCLKDLMSDKKITNNTNNKKNQNQYQNKKPAANKQDLGFNKPVFVNSNKFYNKSDNFEKTEGSSDFGFNSNNNTQNKYNNKYDYKPRQNYNYNTNYSSSLNERPKFFSNKPADENKQQSLNQENIVDKYNMSTNNVYSNLNRNNNNKNEKEDALKKIGTFNTLVKDLQEENSKIKAPKRDYTEIDLTKDKYASERNKEKERNYLQKPQFISKNPNEEPRLLELEKDKDLFLRNVQKIENTNENPGLAGNAKREKFNYKNKDKDFGLDEPRRFINSKKQALGESQNTQEPKTEEEAHGEDEAINNENQHYGTEYRKFKKPRDDFKYYDTLINGEGQNQEEKQEHDDLAHDYKEYKDSYKSHYVNNNSQKYGVRGASDGKDNKPRKNSNIPEPVILKKTDKTLKELLEGK